MAKIHAIVYLILGAVISYVSLRIGSTFTVFFYIGLVFLGVGIAKLLIGFLLKKKETKPEKQSIRVTQPLWAHCPRCRSQVRTSDFFCWRCGNRLR